MRDKVFQEIGKYTKDEILQAIKKTVFRPENVLLELPFIRYNAMCNKAQDFSDKAQKALMLNNFKLSNDLFDKSTKIYEEANKFLDSHNKQFLQHAKEK